MDLVDGVVTEVIQVHDSASEDEEEKSIQSKNEDQVKKRKRNSKKDPEMDYDLEDDFIDDALLFAEDMVGVEVPVEWDFGFFVWKGPLQKLFEYP